MRFLVKTRAPLLILGDLILFYGALLLMLLVRYQELSPDTLSLHLPPFTISAVIWIFVFFIGGLYEIKALRTNDQFYNKFLALIAICAALMSVMFYLIPTFGITPKMNLLIFVGLFTVLDYFWRILFNAIVSMSAPQTKILMLGSNRSAEELIGHLKENPHLGYEISLWMRDGLHDKTANDLKELIQSNHINLIVVPAHIKKNHQFARIVYQGLQGGVEVISLADLFETVFQKVSLSELEETWFLEHVPTRNTQDSAARRFFEIFAAALFLIISLPIQLLAALATKLTSRGPVFYVQKRVGRGGIVFHLYKFRSMYNSTDLNPDAASGQPTWTTENDKRITPIGRILRATHIDELPQLINIMKGEMSFVGPRPERPEFTEELEKQIPFYELRYLLRPGITGWAQINFRYAASVDEAYEKLQYDIYYLKNRSFFMDVLITLKTIKKIFQ